MNKSKSEDYGNKIAVPQHRKRVMVIRVSVQYVDAETGKMKAKDLSSHFLPTSFDGHILDKVAQMKFDGRIDQVLIQRIFDGRNLVSDEKL